MKKLLGGMYEGIISINVVNYGRLSLLPSLSFS